MYRYFKYKHILLANTKASVGVSGMHYIKIPKNEMPRIHIVLDKFNEIVLEYNGTEYLFLQDTIVGTISEITEQEYIEDYLLY